MREPWVVVLEVGCHSVLLIIRTSKDVAEASGGSVVEGFAGESVKDGLFGVVGVAGDIGFDLCGAYREDVWATSVKSVTLNFERGEDRLTRRSSQERRCCRYLGTHQDYRIGRGTVQH